ncbi:MAG: LCP family protein [Patescibacteria group bacterium]
MKNFRKKTKHTDDSQSDIDGFLRKSSSSGFKASNRSSAVTSYADNSVVDGDASSFPGLKSTYRRSVSDDATFEGILYDIDHPDEDTRKRRKLKLPSLRLLKHMVLGCMLVVFLGAGYFVTKGYLTSRSIFNGTSDGAVALNRGVDPSLVNKEGDGRINVLMLGKGGDSHDGGELTDSIVVVSIDPFANSASLLSLPRDLYVDAPGLWSMKINSVYQTQKNKTFDEGGNNTEAEQAGLSKISETVESIIGIPVHYYSMFDFNAVERVVDTIGGLQINVEERLFDSTFSGYRLNVYPGEQVFDGQKTLFYVRSRYTSPRGDFDRSKRQREVLLALKEQVFSVENFANPVRANEMLNILGDSLQTNMSLNEAFLLYDVVRQVETSSIGSLGLDQDPQLVTTGFVGDQSVVIPVEGRNTYAAIQSHVRNVLKDGFLASENATVTVLNGSGLTGYAGRVASELESYGYNVITVQDAPTQDYLGTVIINQAQNKPYTERYLEQRFEVTSTSSVSSLDSGNHGSDFVIIVGANESFD